MPDGFRSESLANQDRSAFSCGVPALDSYFRDRISQDHKRKLAAPYVLVEVDTAAVVGYYTIGSYSIHTASLPQPMTRKLPKYAAYLTILIGRLALDRRYQGRGLGRRLLLDTLYRCLVLSTRLGALAVVVDAKDVSARGCYEHVGFLPLESHSLKLYVPMASIARLLGTEAAPATTTSSLSLPAEG